MRKHRPRGSTHSALPILALTIGLVVWLLLSERLVTVAARLLGSDVGAARLVVTAVPLVLAAAAVLTEHRRTTERQRGAAAREELAAAELIRARELRDTFISGISHELRTPLTSIVGFAATLNDHAELLRTSDVTALSERLVANARRLERLVLGLVDVERFSGASAGRSIVDTVPSELGAIVAETVRRQDRGTHRIRVSIHDRQVELRVDRGRVERLVEELIDNAQRHTPKGGRIDVTVSRVDDAVVLTVDDQGEGVDPNLAEQLFDPFHQHAGHATAHSPGLGIGLTLVDRYARLHGGRTWCERGPLGGARFGVSLPVHGDPSVRPALRAVHRPRAS